MANEALNIELPKTIVTRNIADAAGIAKGTLLMLSGVNIALASPNTSGAAFGGIAVEEKTASDGVTTIGCAMDGVWDIYNCATASGATGSAVCLSGVNTVRACAAGDLLTGALIGYLEETGTASVANRVRLGGKK